MTDPRESATSCHQLVKTKSNDSDMRLGRGCRMGLSICSRRRRASL
jgi:hypothetical protein